MKLGEKFLKDAEIRTDMILAYFDSGVLIAAFRSYNEISNKVFDFFNNHERKFICSDFVKLEIMPKAIFFGNEIEVQFYKYYFENIYEWVEINDKIMDTAYNEAVSNGLSAVDALHLACAVFGKSNEFITTEKDIKPLFRTKLIKVTSIAE